MNRLEQRIRDALAAEATLWPEPIVHDLPTGTPGRLPRPSRWQLRVAIAVGVVALVSVAATWLILRDVSDPVSVTCYEEVHLDSDRVAAGIAGDLDVSLCEEFWEDGPLVNERISPSGEVPPLVGCVTAQGGLAVFPSDSQALCQELGLADPDPGSIPAGNTVRELTEALVDHFSQQECQSIADARQDVRGILDERGFTDWQIQASPGRADRPCASFGIDPPTETVYLVPIPRIP